MLPIATSHVSFKTEEYCLEDFLAKKMDTLKMITTINGHKSHTSIVIQVLRWLDIVFLSEINRKRDFITGRRSIINCEYIFQIHFT